YDARDQEILLSLLPLVAQVGRGGLWLDRMSAEEKVVVLQQLSGLVRELQKTAPLVIDRAVFVRDWKGYGQPLRVPDATFRPGDLVWLYIELQNLVDRPVKPDEYDVRLTGVIEIHDANGRTVWTKSMSGPPSVSQSPRTDHFTAISFSI